ncbi:PREDICTED: protein MAK16 homolog A-like [Camelina sativa]|uniref:Protein MAK16 homolog n=1 Tax=Camelina sativa TaxID=90675 RepID=A0ABM0YC88_CAMSA|nr:PREDICTED: protein MAK16 homolog A-like [Camelina sativa]
MQHDEVIWQVIRHKHCSYMAKIETGIFCRNQYNVTGICNRSSCPLANSRYATIRDHDGVFYLYMKTIERAHMPNNLWERIKLPRNYEQALEMIDKHLLYWPKLLQHKVKQRLTKMTQMRIRMRKLALKTREVIVPMPRRQMKREQRREDKAEKAALLDKAIETELLTRLKTGIYNDIYNYPEPLFNKILDDGKEIVKEVEEEDEEVGVIEYVEGDDELEEEMEDMEDFSGFPSKESYLEDSDDEDEDDAEEQVVIHKKGRALKKSDDNGKSKKKSRVVVEVEQEDGGTRASLKSLKL